MKVAIALLFSIVCFAQVPSSMNGSVVFAIPLVEGSAIGWNFALATKDETGHNNFAWNETSFSISAETPIGTPYQLVTLTGIPSGREILKADDLGCYYVAFHVRRSTLTVSELDGSNPRQSNPQKVDYIQEFCSLGGDADDFWAMGTLTVIQ